MSTARSEFCRQIPTRIFICKYHPERHLLVRYFVIFSRKYSIYHRKTFADAVSLKAPTSTGMHVPWARQLVRDRDRISTCWRHRFSYRSTGWHAKHSSRPSRCIEKLPLHQYIYKTCIRRQCVVLSSSISMPDVLVAMMQGKEIWTFCSTYSQITDLTLALSFS